MKAVLVIDMPDNILLGFSKANIEIKESAYLVNKDENKWKYTKPIKIESIPLRPLPEKKEVHYTDPMFGEVTNLTNIGYNQCIAEILGETE